MLEKDGAGWYPSEPKRLAPKASNKDDRQPLGFDSPDTSKGQQGQQGRAGKKNHEPSENPEPPDKKLKEDLLRRIPGVYRKQIKLFREEVTIEILPKY